MEYKLRTKSFVFKKENRGEADQAFSLFTKDYGRIDINAKGIRKILSKLRSGIDLFYLSEVEYVEGKHNNKILTDALKIKDFENFYRDPYLFSILRQIGNFLDFFIRGEDKDERTYEFLISFLDNLDKSWPLFKEKFLIFQYFFWNFLSLQGYLLEVKKCASCGGKLLPYYVYFSFKEGGVICRNCYKNCSTCQKINSDVVKTLRLIIKQDWDILSRLKIAKSSQTLLQEIYEQTIHCLS